MVSSWALHLCRRALAGAIARGLSLHKRSRLHFVRGSRGERQLGALRMQRIIMRVADALMVTVSRHVIRVENTVTTSNLEALEVDLNGTMSNYFLLSLLVLTYFLHYSSSEYVNMIKRLHVCRTLLCMYLGSAGTYV